MERNTGLRDHIGLSLREREVGVIKDGSNVRDCSPLIARAQDSSQKMPIGVKSLCLGRLVVLVRNRFSSARIANPAKNHARFPFKSLPVPNPPSRSLDLCEIAISLLRPACHVASKCDHRCHRPS